MKAVVVKWSLFLLLGLALIHVLAYISGTVDPTLEIQHTSDELGRLQEALEKSDQIQALSIGNSHSYNIIFDDLGLRGVSLARAGGDLYENDFILRALSPRMPNLDTVFIAISYFSFDWDNSALGVTRDRHAVLYGALPTWETIDGNWLMLLKGKLSRVVPYSRVLREDNWRGVFLSALGLARSAQGNGDSEAQSAPTGCVAPDPTHIESLAVERAAEHVYGVEAMKGSPNGLNVEALEVLERTITYLQTNGIRVVLYTPPYWQGYTSSYEAQAPEQIRQLASNMTYLQRAYGVEYYDFSKDSAFARDISMFADPDHLNLCGKKSFTHELETRMRRGEG